MIYIVLSTTGSIAELKPFTRQLIEEMKGNVGSVVNNRDSRINNTYDNLIRLWDQVIAYARDLPVQPGSGSAWTTFGSYIDQQNPGPNIFWNYDDITYAQTGFTW